VVIEEIVGEIFRWPSKSQIDPSELDEVNNTVSSIISWPV
jgi:hypothetical protein